MEDLQARHRKELKDLQGRITSKKKNATKKTRKGVNDECAALEKETKERHATEIAALDGTMAPDEGAPNDNSQDALDSIEHDQGDVAQLGEKAQSMQLRDEVRDDEIEEPSSRPPGKKQNRQKARMARKAAEQEALVAQAKEEAMSMPDLRKKERERFMEEFERRHLIEKAVAANGHCLYSAVADQLHQLGLKIEPGIRVEIEHGEHEASEPSRDDYKIIREAAASYISANSDDFVPFLEEPLDDYVHKVKDTGEWGGQLELLALAKTYKININVLQGDGRIEKIEGGGTDEERTAWLAYYRHGFGLGEHYNSLRQAADKTTTVAT